MRLRLITEDESEDLADVVIAEVEDFINTVRETGFCKGVHGSRQLGSQIVHWSIAFAGGDFSDAAEFNDVLADPAFREFIDEEFPHTKLVFGHAVGSDTTVNVRFNPYQREHIADLDAETLRNEIQWTIDHEGAHVQLGDIPRRDDPSPAQYPRMPDELHSNLVAMVKAYQRARHRGLEPSLDDLLNLYDLGPYRSPKWRKIIRHGLARRGVVVRH